MYNRKKRLVRGKRDDRSLDNYALYDCYFCIYDVKTKWFKAICSGSILAGIALITYVISIFIESVSVDMSTSLMFIGITLFAGSIMVLMVAGIILFIHMNSETL